MDLVVWGAWEQVRAVPGYAEVLAEQAPESDKEAIFSKYFIPCETSHDLFKAAGAFRAAGLQVDLDIHFRSKDKLVSFWMTTAKYAPRELPSCDIIAPPSQELLRDKIKKAIELLKEVVP